MRTYELFSGDDLKVAELILRRRMQMMVHSYIYYTLNTNIITDRQFDEWGKELVKLQADYPEIAKQVNYADDFEDWDASTGFHLPENDHIISIANGLLMSRHKTKKEVKKPEVKKKPVKKSLF